MPEFPLSTLRHSARNMRTVGKDDGLDELIDSMRHRHARGQHPLIQNLRGVQVSPKKVEVHAGGRRLTALLKLKDEGVLPSSFLVPVELDAMEDAIEVSIMENTLRVPPHPYDQFVSFKKLADQGHSPEVIAQRFGTKASWVRQRLALAGLHPELLELLKTDQLPIACAQALTLSSDPAQQLDAWMRLPAWQRDQHTIKRILRDARTPISAAFFPIAEYVKRGGVVERDLFDERDQGCIGSPALFAEMQRDAVDKRIAELKADGWGEVIECDPAHSWYHHASSMGLEDMDFEGTRGLTDEEMAEHDQLSARHDAINEMPEEEYEANRIALENELQQIEAKLEQLDQLEAVPVYSPEQRAGGVVLVVYVPPQNLVVKEGYTRQKPVDEEHEPGQPGGQADGQQPAPQANDNPQPATAKVSEPAEDSDGSKPYANAVLQSLAVAKSHAIQDIVAGDYDLALRIALYQLIDGGYLLNLGVNQYDRVGLRVNEHVCARANQALTEGLTTLLGKIGLADATLTPLMRNEQFIVRHPERWQAVMNAPMDLIRSAFAYIVARGVGVHAETMRSPEMYRMVVEGYGLRMAHRWRPDAKFLMGLTKAQLHQILLSNGLHELSARWKDCKKGDLVEHIGKMFDGMPPAGLGPTMQNRVLDLIGSWVPNGLDFYVPTPTHSESEAA